MVHYAEFNSVNFLIYSRRYVELVEIIQRVTAVSDEPQA